jgi:hypothetical protein
MDTVPQWSAPAHPCQQPMLHRHLVDSVIYAMYDGCSAGWVPIPPDDVPDEMRFIHGPLFGYRLSCGCAIVVKGPR